MSGEVKNFEIHVFEKIKVAAELTVKPHARLIRTQPIIFLGLIALIFLVDFFAIFVIPGVIGKAVSFLISIALFIWGPSLYEKAKGLKKPK